MTMILAEYEFDELIANAEKRTIHECIERLRGELKEVPPVMSGADYANTRAYIIENNRGTNACIRQLEGMLK